MKKIISALLCLLFLSGCRMYNSAENYTNSIKDETLTAPETLTTEPTVQPVAGLESLSVKKVIWGPGNITGHKQPTEPLALNEKYSSLGGRWFVSGEKNVALTFDEGYENGFTPSILDVLKEKQVKAVFFVTYDFARDNNDLIRRMIDEGHIVGNHSYHHYSMDELDSDSAREEISFLHDYIKDNFNYTMRYFRFPKGEFSEKSLAIAQSLGYESIFWSFAYADWDVNAQEKPDKALAKICEATHPGEIMLLHAVSKTNAEILGRVIDDVRQQGYSFTVSLN